MNNFYYTKTSKKSFDQTVDSLSKTIEENAFKILAIHDIQNTFAGKGIEHGPYKIIEFCRAPAAKKVLDADPLIGLFLPCRAVVHEKDGVVTVSVMRPTLMKSMFPDADLGDLPETIEEEIVQLIDQSIS